MDPVANTKGQMKTYFRTVTYAITAKDEAAADEAWIDDGPELATGGHVSEENDTGVQELCPVVDTDATN